MTEKYTDRDRQKIANKEYSAYKFRDEVNIGNLEHPRYIGTVQAGIYRYNRFGWLCD